MKPISVHLIGIFALLIPIYILPQAVLGQKKSAVFESETITWHGLDFSGAKMVGQFAQFKDAGQKGGESIKKTYFNAWNNVIVLEPEKYALAEIFHVKKVNTNLDDVFAINAKVDESQLMVNAPTNNEFTAAQIQQMTKKYSNSGQGIGVVFLVEKFDKLEDLGVVNVVYFDKKSGNVLFSDQLKGKSGGFGIKNYWAKSIYNIMKEIKATKWRKWKKQYSKE